MIDDDDVAWVALLWPSDNPILAVIGIFVVCGFAYVACQNDNECHAKTCEHGEPQLLKGECVCTERAK